MMEAIMKTITLALTLALLCGSWPASASAETLSPTEEENTSLSSHLFINTESLKQGILEFSLSNNVIQSSEISVYRNKESVFQGMGENEPMQINFDPMKTTVFQFYLNHIQTQNLLDIRSFVWDSSLRRWIEPDQKQLQEYLSKQSMETSKFQPIEKLTNTILINVPSNKVSIYTEDGTLKVNDLSGSMEVINGRTMIPIRGIFDELGAQITYDGKRKMVLFFLNNQQMILFPNDKEVYVNGIKETVTPKPIIKNGRILVPLRFISESLGMDVQYFETKREIRITQKPDLANKGL